LQRAAADISIGEVFRAVEEPASDRDWPRSNGATSQLWLALDEHIRDFLEGVSVADVMAGRINGHANGAVSGLVAGVSA
jgi:DNA-binding IscR family transcriptional regulator